MPCFARTPRLIRHMAWAPRRLLHYACRWQRRCEDAPRTHGNKRATLSLCRRGCCCLPRTTTAFHCMRTTAVDYLPPLDVFMRLRRTYLALRIVPPTSSPAVLHSSAIFYRSTSTHHRNTTPPRQIHSHTSGIPSLTILANFCDRLACVQRATLNDMQRYALPCACERA